MTKVEPVLHKKVSFNFETKKILNSNSMPNHIMVKSQRAAFIRKTAAEYGVENHSSPELAQQRYDAFKREAALRLAKSRLKKKMNKSGKSNEEILEAQNELEMEAASEVKSDDIDVPFLFNKFKLVVTVCAPTKRKLDPPNLYPTVKPIIDGLTDASWWEDDEFEQLLEVSFRYGGLSGNSKEYRIILDFFEVPESDIDSYVTKAVQVEGLF